MNEATNAVRSSAGVHSGRPWSQAWIDAFPAAPAWVGIILAVLHVLAGVVWYTLLVAPEPSAGWQAFRPVLDSTAVFALLIGYGPAALAYARRGQRTALAELRGSLRCSEAELSEAQRTLERFDRRRLRHVGLVFAAASAVVTLFTTGLIDRFGPRSPELMWIVWQNALAFWLVGRTIAHDLHVSRLFARWTERWAEVDPLDQVGLAPLARRGLQSALLIILALSIFTLVFGVGNISPVLPFLHLLSVGLAAFALFLPSVGVHRRLRAARRNELGRLGAEIRAVRAEASSDEARLTTLLTLRQHVEAAREWPFDLGTLGRFALYAAIGLGSWLGGALVERVLDVMLR